MGTVARGARRPVRGGPEAGLLNVLPRHVATVARVGVQAVETVPHHQRQRHPWSPLVDDTRVGLRELPCLRWPIAATIGTPGRVPLTGLLVDRGPGDEHS